MMCSMQLMNILALVTMLCENASYNQTIQVKFRAVNLHYHDNQIYL